MGDGTAIQLGLFGVAGVTGNLGFMIWSGIVPGPPGQWFSPTVGMLVLLSIQCLGMMIVVDAKYRDAEVVS